MSRVVALLLLALPAVAQQNYYRFHVDQDRLAGAPDFSFLNRPLEAADRVFVRDGHFYRVGPDLAPNTADDERVRMFGVNLAFGANLPAETDAPRVARRLRRLGVNVVRLHHLDTQPDRDPNNAGGILNTAPYPTLNPVAIARLRAFLQALKAEGIYINLNLHVGYQFRPDVDGVPAVPAGVPFPTQSKPLHIFFPAMVERQAEFTRKIIDALALKDDPVLAMVEVNNESSLLYSWQTSGLDRYLPGEYGVALQRQWNDDLATRYGSTDELRAAWGESEPDGPELLGGGWRLEIHAPAQASLEMVTEDDLPTVRVNVARSGNWVIVKQTGFSISTDRVYLAEVEIRSELPDGASRSVYWDIKQDVNPWRTLTGRTVSVTNRWQKFTMAVRPTFAMENIGRFGLSVENGGEVVYIRNWSLRVAGRRGLSPEEGLEGSNIALVGENEVATDARTNDYLLFLAERDRAYLGAMQQAARETTDALVPVAGTQMGYGGLLNLDSHTEMDYDDNHFYVDHYNFPSVAWDGRDWRIRDASSLGSGLAAFQSMAVSRAAGRPFTVSEFNQPWPNSYAAEIDPTLAAFAAFQDWDSIMHFAYSHGRNWDDGVPNGFNINGDWTKFPNVGQSAWLFRTGAIQAGPTAIDLPISREARLRAGREKRNSNINAFLSAALGYNPDVAFVYPVRLARDAERSMPEAARVPRSSPFRTETAEITYDRDARLFLLHAPMAAGVFGFAGQRKITAGAMDVELGPEARGFAAILLSALDGRPLSDSGRMLLTNPGAALRTQPLANPPSPQKLVNYSGTRDWWTLELDPTSPLKPSGNLNGGQQPVWMERVESWVTLRSSAARITVYPLDGAGGRMDPLAAEELERIEGGFRIHLNAASPWYELIADP